MITERKILDIIKPLIIQEEGLRHIVYPDTLGNPTVGIGHLVLPSDNLKLGDRITDARINTLFKADIGPVVRAAMDQASEIGELEEDFVLALAQVNFQLGTNWPAEWPNTYKNLLAGNWSRVMAAVEGSKWARQTPARAGAFIKALLTEQKEEEEGT